MINRTSFYLVSVLFTALILSNNIFAQSQKKAVVGIFLDNSGSLEKQFTDTLMLGRGIIKRVHPSGPIGLFHFKMGAAHLEITEGVAWSQDESELDKYLNGLSVALGRTPLFEAIQSIAEQVEAKANSDKGGYGEKVIILITDGEDRIERWKGRLLGGPQYEDEEKRRVANHLIKKLKQSGIKVLSIGLTRELDGDRLIKPTPRERAESILKKISKETGGRAVISKSKKIDVNSLLDELLAQ
ncbi:MAG: VWA domain-containing protein [Pyrinomonadaceae bacterium]